MSALTQLRPIAASAALALTLAAACHDDAASPRPLPPLEVRVTEAPAPATDLHPADEVSLSGDASAPDLGPLPDDSLWWTDNGQSFARGRAVRRLIGDGEHAFVLHASYGTRRDSTAAVRLTARGAGIGRVLWTVPLTRTFDNQGELAIGADGTAYVLDGPGALVAVAPDGAVRWRTPLDVQVDGSLPVVAPDGTILVGFAYSDGTTGGVVAVAPSGERKWIFRVRDHAPTSDFAYHVHGTPAVGPDGAAYIVTEEFGSVFYAVNPDGTLRWRVSAREPGCIACGSFFGPTVMVGDSLVVAVQRDGTVTAVSTDGTPRWWRHVDASGLRTADQYAPAVSRSGDLYVITRTVLTRVAPDGTVVWQRPNAGRGGPTLAGGVLFLGIWGGGGPGLVQTFSEEGVPLSLFAGDGVYVSGSSSGPTLARNGVMYIALTDSLISLDRTGMRRFAVPIRHGYSTAGYLSGGPLVAPDGNVYLRVSQTGLIAVRDTVGPATDADWPAVQGGATRSGRRTTP